MDNFLKRLRFPVIVSAQGASTMNYSEEFRRFKHKEGKRDPWSIEPKRQIFEDKIDEKTGIKYTTVTINSDVSEADIIAWEKYRDEWIKERDEYVALRLLDDYGWEAFKARCKLEKLDDLLTAHNPCESRNDPACNIDCQFYNYGCSLLRKED